MEIEVDDGDHEHAEALAADEELDNYNPGTNNMCL